MELVYAWYKYYDFVADCSNDNWDLLLQKETNSTPVKLGLADSSSHSQTPSFAFPTFFPFFADQNKQFQAYLHVLDVISRF